MIIIRLSSQISVLKNLKGIKDKFKEITDDSKIPSVLSELSFAYLFAKHDFEVELIYDGHARASLIIIIKLKALILLLLSMGMSILWKLLHLAHPIPMRN